MGQALHAHAGSIPCPLGQGQQILANGWTGRQRSRGPKLGRLFVCFVFCVFVLVVMWWSFSCIGVSVFLVANIYLEVGGWCFPAISTSPAQPNSNPPCPPVYRGGCLRGPSSTRSARVRPWTFTPTSSSPHETCPLEALIAVFVWYSVLPYLVRRKGRVTGRRTGTRWGGWYPVAISYSFWKTSSYWLLLSPRRVGRARTT